MKDLLYIDGQIVDLHEGVDITLNYKSNMLTDLSKIVGNNSYTIKLPKTARNLSIIGCADMPSAVTSFPRVTHKARYFRNGVELVPDGRAVLMAVSDAIEIVLAWGNTSALSRLVEDGKSLNELDMVTDYVTWTTATSGDAYNGTSNILLSDMNIGLNRTTSLAGLHPSVRSSYIFNLIKNHYGLSVSFPDEKKEFISSLIVPLLTRNGGYANRLSNEGAVALSEVSGEETIIKNGSEFDSYFEPVYSAGALFGFRALVDCRVVITPTFKALDLGGAVMHGATVSDNIVYLPYDMDYTSVVPMYNYNKPVEIDLTADDTFRVVRSIGYVPTGLNGTYYTIGAQPKEVQIGDKFPIAENLPDIEIVEFIKAVASLAGLFAIPSSDGNTLRFVSFDLLGDKTRALDWSDKLIANDSTNRPRNIGYTLDGFARNNRMKWTEDKTVALFADGNIVVGDSTLEYERDSVELPFAPTDMILGKATIKLYEFNDDGEPELQSVEPRILIEKNVGGYSTGTFDGLQWTSLIANYYKTYQNAVKSPVVLTENFILDELSLRDLDVSVPVYLRQYGKYYAIVEVKAPSSGVCECKLLQLED